MLRRRLSFVAAALVWLAVIGVGAWYLFNVSRDIWIR
jgi:hypothetical protein